MNKFKQKILILKIKNKKDAQAFGQIYDAFVDKIYRFIFFKVSSKEEAEDITSEVFLKSWGYLIKKENAVKNLNNFLYQIAKNLVIDFYRKKNHQPIGNEDLLKQVEDESSIAFKDKIDLDIEFSNIEKFLKYLKDEYREVVILKYLENYSAGEIAEILNKTKGNVRVLLHRALKALQDMVKENKS